MVGQENHFPEFTVHLDQGGDTVESVTSATGDFVFTNRSSTSPFFIGVRYP